VLNILGMLNEHVASTAVRDKCLSTNKKPWRSDHHSQPLYDDCVFDALTLTRC